MSNPASRPWHLAESAADMTPDLADAFDAVACLNRFAAIGGGYALTSGRKLHFLVEVCEADDLTHSMAELVGHAERQEAVKRTIELRSLGQVR